MFGVDELGMDLGTSTLHIVVRGKGIVLSEPAYVAYDRQTRNVVAVGEEARRMYGRTPAGLIVERPLRDGRIRSFDLVSKMLRYFMRKVIGKRATFRPKLLLALPGGMAPSERQTLVDVLVDAGVRSVVPVDESVASAIGAGMRIDQPYGRMNIDIGGGTYVHGIPGGVAFGASMPGFVSNLHGPDERVNVADLLTAAMIYTQVILDVCGE